MDSKFGKCIWCEEQTKLSKTHIFPKVIGGLFASYLSCPNCNRFFGKKVESQILKNSIFVAALWKNGLKNSQEAYRFAKKIDENTGNTIHFKNDEAIVAPQKITQNHFRASVNDRDKYHDAQLKKMQCKYPNSEVHEYKINKDLIAYCINDHILVKTNYPSQRRKIRLEGLTLLPTCELVCKIVYEIAGLLGLHEMAIFKQMKETFIHVNIKDPMNRIIIDKNIGYLILCNAIHEFGQIGNKEKHEYDNYHSITFWVTTSNVFYVELSFFGYLKCYHIIGQVNHEVLDSIESICEWEIYFSWEPPYVESKKKFSATDEINNILKENHDYIDNVYNKILLSYK